MNAPATQIRKGRKYDQVLAGARDVFLRAGFEGASVDDIARAAGVSKATLYSYFADKHQLFTVVARTECERMSDETLQMIDMDRPPREVMVRVAKKIVSFLVSGFAQRVFRICVAEADRFPELGKQFYEAGPKLGRQRTEAYLRMAAERGELAIDDFPLAAEQFAELCKADLWNKAAFGIQTDFSDAEIERVAAGAVDMFMARYGVELTDEQLQ